jgi:hypothetical protein
MGILFELLNGTEELACNFYYSTVSPDHQAGTGVPPRSPGPRPNFAPREVQHLLCPACGLTLPQVLESWSAWGHWRARNPGNNAGPKAKALWLLRPRRRRARRRRQLEQPTSKAPTATAETKEKTTTKAAEQGTTTRTAAAALPAAHSAPTTQSAALDPSNPPSAPPPPPPTPTPHNTPPPHANHAMPLHQDGSDSYSDYSALCLLRCWLC